MIIIRDYYNDEARSAVPHERTGRGGNEVRIPSADHTRVLRPPPYIGLLLDALLPLRSL